MDVRDEGIEYGLFKNLVTRRKGRRVSNPIKPYEHEYIPPKWEKPELRLPMAYTKLEYTGYFVFVKVLNFNTRRKILNENIVADMTHINDTPVEPKEIKEPEVVEVDLDKLSSRTLEDAYEQLQELAHQISPVRDSQGLSDLRKMTKKQLVDFIIKYRKLIVKMSASSIGMPNKNELISICLHGYTDKTNTLDFQYNTKHWAKRFYNKVDLVKLLKSKGCKVKPTDTVPDLFDNVWRRGYLQREPWLEEVPVTYKRGKLEGIKNYYKKKGVIKKN